MIAQTIKNGKSVCLSADYHVDTEKVYFTVCCFSFDKDRFRTTFEFCEFAPAARVYKSISKRIESEDEFLASHIHTLAYASRSLGYSVKEVA